MDIQLRGERIEVTQALRNYTEQKIGHLQKFLNMPLDRPATVALSVDGNQHRVEVAFQVHGVLFRAEERTQDMYASIDLVADKLEKQIDKHRTRLHKQLHGRVKDNRTHGDSSTSSDLGAGDVPLTSRIGRVKKFPAKPMALEEAILQMELLGHDFFVFTNGDTQEVNVLYRRHCGDVGLMEPQ